MDTAATVETSSMLDLEAMAAAAALAPSAHNTQPWHFRIWNDQVEVLADRTRALAVNDPRDRELTMSCGGAIFNLRVAAAAADHEAIVELLPRATDPDLLARVRFRGPVSMRASELASLEPALHRRRTCRLRFEDEPVPAEGIEALRLAAAAEDAGVAPLSSPSQRDEFLDVLQEADRRLWTDESWRRELSAWMHPRRKDDGFLIPGLTQMASEWVMRTFDLGKGVAARERQILDGSPLIIVLGTPSDSVLDWLAAGQALEHLLLRACISGLQASFLGQPLHFPALRERLRLLAPEAGLPQAVLRVGRPRAPISPTRRRPMPEVLDVDWLTH